MPRRRRRPSLPSALSARAVRRIFTVGIAALGLLVGVSSSAHSAIDWSGGYETGNFSQWSLGVQEKAPDRATVVSNSSLPGGYMARFEVDPGDNNVAGSGSNGERTEALTSTASTGAYPGTEQWWAWSTYWDPSFTSTTSNWNYFTQFHNTGSTGQANVGWISAANLIKLRVCNGSDATQPSCTYWTLDSNRQNGRWYNFVFHVKWSSDSSVGFVEMWENGQQVVPLTHIANLYTDQGVYLKQGYYRVAQSTTAVIYDYGMRRGSTYQDVVAGFPTGTWSTTLLDPPLSPPPAIVGSPVVGQVLTADVDTSGLPSEPTKMTYQWKRCAPGSSSCTDIAGATGPFYAVADGDVGSQLRVFVTVETSTAVYTGTSDPTATVTGTVAAVTQSISDGQTLSGKVSWTATPNVPVEKVEFAIDGSDKWTENYTPYVFDGDGNTLDTTKLSNGTHSFTVTAYLTDGTTAESTVSATVSNGSAPVTSSPTTTTSTSSSSVSQSISSGQTLSGKVSWTASPSGTAKKVVFSIDGSQKWTENQSPYVFDGDGSTLDTTTLSDGSHTFAVTAYMSDGSTASSTVTANVSNPKAPAASVSQSISGGQTVSGKVSWTASPSGSAKKVVFSIDGSAKWTENISPYVFNGDGNVLDTKTLSNGSHTFTVTAYMSDGSTASSSVTATVKN
jgi:hypothetical protein